jgi:ABC-type polysaccharide/polyol phosphate export permease
VFVDAVDVSHKAFSGARSYLTKVNCPREAIVLAQFYETVIVAGVRLALLVLLVGFFSAGGWGAAGVLALCFAGALLLGLGIGAHVMPLTILFADVQHAVRMALAYGVFFTPAFYAPGGADVFARLVRYSPLAPLMTAARDAAAGMTISDAGLLAATFGVAVVVAVGGVFMIRVSAPILVERMLVEGR